MSKPRANVSHTKSAREHRGRSAIHKADPYAPTTPHVPQEVRREANRPVNAGGGKRRGDRRDTSPTYTGNTRHAARGNSPRPDVKTRKR